LFFCAQYLIDVISAAAWEPATVLWDGYRRVDQPPARRARRSSGLGDRQDWRTGVRWGADTVASLARADHAEASLSAGRLHNRHLTLGPRRKRVAWWQHRRV